MGSFNRTLYQKAQFAHPGTIRIDASFEFAGGSDAPDAAVGKPFAVGGTDLARSDTGDFTLTVPGDGDLGLISVQFCFLEDTDVLSCKLVGISEANRTLSFTFYDGETQATPTDPPDGAKLFVSLVLKGREGL